MTSYILPDDAARVDNPDFLQSIPIERRQSLARSRLGNVRAYLAELEAGKDDWLHRHRVEYVETNLANDDLRRYCDREAVVAVIRRARALGLFALPLGGDDVTR